MANALKRFLESVLFAGLKPSAPGQAPSAAVKPGAAARAWNRLARWAAGATPDDPLYLSNRTWQQKLRLGLILGMPGLLVVGVIALMFAKILIPKAPPPPKQLTNAEIIAQILPELEKTVSIERYEDAEILEIGVDRAASPPKLRGKIRNNTGRELSVAFSADLSEFDGTRVGAVSERVLDIPAHESVLFDFPLKPTTAAVALVRQIRTIP